MTSTPGPTYNSDPSIGPILMSSHIFSYAIQPGFPYGGFYFGSNFSMTSTSFSRGKTSYEDSLGTSFFSSIPSQLISVGEISSLGVNTYVMGHIDVSFMEGTCKCPRPILDLNATPGIVCLEIRDSKQFSISDGRVSPKGQTRLFN